MPFQEEAESMGSRLRARGVKRPVAVGLIAIAALVLVAAGALCLSSVAQPEFEVARADAVGAVTPAEPASDAADGGAASGSSQVIVVHVGGAVACPGVYELALGSRVGDAVAAADGMTEEASPDALNLARLLTDGEQVIVPCLGEDPTAPAAVGSGAGAPGSRAAGDGSQPPSPGSVAGKVNLNTASAEALATLPGIGPATAAKIVADREANGPFKAVGDLVRVSGIGEKKLERIADLATVG